MGEGIIGKKKHFEGLIYINIASIFEVSIKLLYGFSVLFSLIQIALVTQIPELSILFSTKILPKIISLMQLATMVLFLIGLYKLKPVNPYFRKAHTYYMYSIAVVLASIALIVSIIVFGGGVYLLAFQSGASDIQSLNAGEINKLMWTVVTIMLGQQSLSAVLNILYIRNILFGTRRIMDVFSRYEESQRLISTEKLYRISMIVATVIEVVGSVGSIFVINKYIFKIAENNADAFIALYNTFRGIKIFLFILIVMYIVSLVVKTIFAIRITHVNLEISKHEMNSDEEAALLEDMQAVQELHG